MKKQHRLIVNMIECEAHGVCAELFPERVQLDEWGYPIIDDEPIPTALLKHAPTRRAELPEAGADPDRRVSRRASATGSRREEDPWTWLG